jgi:hypothetical protein
MPAMAKGGENTNKVFVCFVRTALMRTETRLRIRLA